MLAPFRASGLQNAACEAEALQVQITASVAVSGGVVLGTDDQTTALLCAAVYGLDDVDELLLVLKYPVELVVISRAKIAHHVFVAEEEHEGDGVVKLVHLLKVGDLVDVADVDDGKVLDAVCDACGGLLAYVLGQTRTREGDDARYNTSSWRMQSGSQSRPKRMTTKRSSSDMMAWSTCQPVTRCGSTTEPILCVCVQKWV